MTRRASALLLALLLATSVAVAACSSDSAGSDAGDSGATTAVDGDKTTVPEETITQTTGKNPGDAKPAEGPASAENTVTWTKDKTFDPANLEVTAGEVFTFKAAQDAGTAAVTFDGDQSYTISGGLTESFTLDTPGTYTVSETVTGQTMTIIVGG